MGSRSLADLFIEQRFLEETFTNDEITDDNDIIWANNELEIRDKIDAYGFILQSLSAENEKLLAIVKPVINEKIGSKVKSIEGRIERIKKRLFTLSDGKSLRGNLFSFHPYESTRHTLGDVNKIEDEYIIASVEMPYSLYKSLCSWDLTKEAKESIVLKNKKVRITDLPENHPEIIKVKKPSVRIT